MRIERLALPLLLLLLPSVAAAQAAPFALTPLLEHRAPLSAVGAVAELSDGRVLVIDSRDATVLIADIDKGTSVQVGRTGSGPGEYRRPFALHRIGRDSFYVQDIGRMLVFAGSGFSRTVVTEPAIIRPRPPSGFPSSNYASAIDGLGRLYYQGTYIDIRSGQAADSIPLYRVDTKSLRQETVAWLRLHASDADPLKKNANGMMGARIKSSPYDVRDIWGVLTDGTVLIARADGYRIETISPTGRKALGPPIPYPKRKIPSEVRASTPELPEIMAPFWAEPPSLDRTGENGTFWVRRHTGKLDDAATYDLFDRAGRFVRQVVFPKNTLLAGFGERYVYGVREDDDGLMYLQRYAYPR